jgi:hypothetical protein
MAKFDTLNDASWVLLGKLTLSGTSTVTTSLVDMFGYDALDIAFVNGTVTDAGTASGFTSKLQEADVTTAASFTDVATANAVNGVATVTTTLDTDDDKIAGVLGYIGSKRYVRVSATGTTLSDATVLVIGRRSRSGLSRPNATVGTATAAT